MLFSKLAEAAEADIKNSDNIFLGFLSITPMDCQFENIK